MLFVKYRTTELQGKHAIIFAVWIHSLQKRLAVYALRFILAMRKTWAMPVKVVLFFHTTSRSRIKMTFRWNCCEDIGSFSTLLEWIKKWKAPVLSARLLSLCRVNSSVTAARAIWIHLGVPCTVITLCSDLAVKTYSKSRCRNSTSKPLTLFHKTHLSNCCRRASSDWK